MANRIMKHFYDFAKSKVMAMVYRTKYPIDNDKTTTYSNSIICITIYDHYFGNFP